MIRFEYSKQIYILKYVGKTTHDYEMIVNGISHDFRTERDVRNFIQQHQTKNMNNAACIPTLDFVVHLRNNFYQDLSSDVVVQHDIGIHGIIF